MMSMMTVLRCWQCTHSVDPDEVEWGAVLLPRAASRGGPVLLISCRHCGSVNLVERNGAGEKMLCSPAVAGYLPPEAGEAENYAAVRWAERNRELRHAFLTRAGVAKQEAAPRETPPDPAAAEHESPTGPEPVEDPSELSGAADLIDAYEILGLPLTASGGDIRDRYRELARKCHPDRVSDLDEDIRRLADRKFRRLKSAYDLIRRRSDPPGLSGTRS